LTATGILLTSFRKIPTSLDTSPSSILGVDFSFQFWIAAKPSKAASWRLLTAILGSGMWALLQYLDLRPSWIPYLQFRMSISFSSLQIHQDGLSWRIVCPSHNKVLSAIKLASDYAWKTAYTICHIITWLFYRIT
jgi:hypothetical protein